MYSRSSLGAQPALRITHRHQDESLLVFDFDWYFCPLVGAFRHLVLLAAQQPCAQWVLPAVGECPPEPTTGLWMQVSPALNLALPASDAASCQGIGRAVSQATPTAMSVPPLLPEQLVLHLPTAVRPDEHFWLRRLRPGSAAWLLSKEQSC
jgi:hypothetical protein